MSKKLIVGDMIRYYLQQNKMTIKELGLKLGKGESTVSKWINNKNMPMAKDLSSMTCIFNTDIQTLMYGADEKDELITKTEKTMQSLTPDRQQNVYNYADNQLKEQQDGKVVAMPVRDDKVELQANGVLSAGVGEFLDDSAETFPVMVSKPIPDSFDYIFKVNGRSMEPTFEDGQVIFVTEHEEYRNGQIIAVVVDGCAYVKRLKYTDDSMTLVSLNPAYPNVQVLEDDEYRILGVAFA